MTIDMTRHQGDQSVPVLECTDTRLQTYRVRADIQPYEEQREGAEETTRGVTFIETEFPYKPSMDEVKEFVLAVIDAQTDAKILNGYPFTPDGAEEPIIVWLSKESQTNFSEAHRLQIVPVKFKLNEDEQKQPIYHTFTDFEELDRFYKGGVVYINQCLNEGWAVKDAIDWTPYEQALGISTAAAEPTE